MGDIDLPCRRNVSFHSGIGALMFWNVTMVFVHDFVIRIRNRILLLHYVKSTNAGNVTYMLPLKITY